MNAKQRVQRRCQTQPSPRSTGFWNVSNESLLSGGFIDCFVLCFEVCYISQSHSIVRVTQLLFSRDNRTLTENLGRWRKEWSREWNQNKSPRVPSLAGTTSILTRQRACLRLVAILAEVCVHLSVLCGPNRICSEPKPATSKEQTHLLRFFGFIYLAQASSENISVRRISTQNYWDSSWYEVLKHV